MQIESNTIQQLTQNVWSVVLGMDVNIGSIPSRIAREDRSVAGCVQISGDPEFAVILHTTSDFARLAAAAMLCVEPHEPSTTDIQDAIGELTNMVGGSLKNLLPNATGLSVPAVAEGIDFSLRLPGARTLREISMQCQGYPLIVSVLERFMRQ